MLLAVPLRHHDTTLEVVDGGEGPGVTQALGQLPGPCRRALGVSEFGKAVDHRRAAEPARGLEGGAAVGAVAVLRECRFGDFPGLAVEVDGGAIGGELLGVLGGAQQGLERLRTVLAAGEVVREEGRPLGVRLAGARLEERADPLVELAALPEEQALVRDLLRQALAEAVLVGR